MPEENGWSYSENSGYTIEWDDAATQQKVQQMLAFLTKGCNCCKTNLCSRCKRQSQCGPACECHNCTNTTTLATTTATCTQTILEDQSAVSHDSSNEDDEDESILEETEDEETLEFEVVTDTEHFSFIDII